MKILVERSKDGNWTVSVSRMNETLPVPYLVLTMNYSVRHGLEYIIGTLQHVTGFSGLMI